MKEWLWTSYEFGNKRLNCMDKLVSHTEGNGNKKGITFFFFEGDHFLMKNSREIQLSGEADWETYLQEKFG